MFWLVENKFAISKRELPVALLAETQLVYCRSQTDCNINKPVGEFARTLLSFKATHASTQNCAVPIILNFHSGLELHQMLLLPEF